MQFLKNVHRLFIREMKTINIILEINILLKTILLPVSSIIHQRLIAKNSYTANNIASFRAHCKISNDGMNSLGGSVG